MPDGARDTAPAERELAEEVPVAFVYNGESHAVMMATPADLADFAVGFTLTDGVLRDAAGIEAVEVIRHELGVELRLSVPPAAAEALRARRRATIGPVGCGLCGVETLAQAVPPVQPVAAQGPTLSGAQIAEAVAALRTRQPLHDRTRAVHAAGFWRPGHGFVAVREDVGRHNAVDKLAGALAARGEAGPGALILTSRVSVELVQKAAAVGIGAVVAVSAPTALAVRVAEAAGVTLISNARDGGHRVRTHPEQVSATRCAPPRR